jgi:hypothetical protein
LKFIGGAFKRPINVLDKLKREANIDVPKELRFYPYRITYDIEAMLNPDRKDLPPDTETVHYVNEHRFLSVSVCSNVPGFERPECFVRDERGAEACVVDFVAYAHRIADKAFQLMSKKFANIFDQLTEAVKRREELEVKYENAEFSNWHVWRKRRNFCQLEKELVRYLREVPIVGFNSQRYYLNVIEGALIKAMKKTGDEVDFVVKKMEAMTCLKTIRLKFLDVSNFIAPGFSYAKYLDAYGIDQRKGYFP